MFFRCWTSAGVNRAEVKQSVVAQGLPIRSPDLGSAMVPLTDPRHYHAGLQSATLQNVSVRWLSHQHSNEMIPPNYLCIHNLLFNVCLFLLKIINTIEQSPRHQSLNKGHCYYYYLYSISIWLIPITLKTYFCLSPVIRHPQKRKYMVIIILRKINSVTGLNPRGAGVRIQTVLVTAGYHTPDVSRWWKLDRKR